MNKLAHISVAYFIVINTIYELFAPPSHTNLSILYFASVYITFMIYCINNWIKHKQNIDVVIFIGFFTRLILELNKWGMSYEEYIRSVNNYEKSVLLAFLTIALTLAAISHDRRKRK